MKRSPATMLAAAVLLTVAAAANGSESDLAKRVTQQDGWVAWQVPMADDAGMPCCFEWHDQGAGRAQCDLESRNWSISTNDRDPRQALAGDLNIFLHVGHGEVDKVRAYAAACSIRNADQVRRFDPVAPADSIALLARLSQTAPHEAAEGALTSLALHADAAATGALERLADASHPRKLREQALFWLGQARGLDGANFIERVANSDADADLRANAIFALSQAHGLDAYASIHRLAQNDASEHVREQALFWMAQMNDKRAKADILATIASDASNKVREQAVFALSQLKDDQGEAALIAIVRGDYPRKVKQQALFWLGQSGSTQALDFLDDVLTRAPGQPKSG